MQKPFDIGGGRCDKGASETRSLAMIAADRPTNFPKECSPEVIGRAGELMVQQEASVAAWRGLLVPFAEAAKKLEFPGTIGRRCWRCWKFG
jgi:hypothetical protein